MCVRASLLFAVLASCLPASAEAQEGTAAQTEFFERRIRPLLVKHCYSCHSRDAKKIRGELLLDTRAGIQKGGASGPALVAGKPDESLIIQAVRHSDDDLKMPPNGKLSAEEIADLVAWVKMGAPDPRTEKVLAKASGINIEEGRKHWAYQPLREPPLPPQAPWTISPIDRFVLAKLTEKGLSPAPPADGPTLIRRIYFDLTGLPPAPEEVDDFLREFQASAKRQAAIAKVVDRLLASPHYGERWGRHWLDVVRYADTAGDNSDYPIPQMYRYRNWVIDAFNRDLPYDQFIRLQLAGDLLTDDEVKAHENIIATGYLANSRRHGSYEDARYPWHLTIEDTLDNLGKAFLGVTLGCARCHDHKFDPISAEDYYALYGFFSSTRYPWPGIELEKYQRDLVPLASAANVQAAAKDREHKLVELNARVSKLEADKTVLEKSLRELQKQQPEDDEQGPIADLQQQIAESVKNIQSAKQDRDRYAKQPLPFEMAYAVIDGRNEPKKRIGQVGNARLMMKGDPDRLGKEVPRRFPVVLGGQTLPPSSKGSGRTQLGDWIADPANPLTARVMVNRIWQQHFGRGIVATPNDFGKQGQPPTHPELLDYLARRFIDSGWSIKAMHRLIALSASYQQSSESGMRNPELKSPGSESRDPETIDPDNVYLWQFTRRRLDAESIRDALLAVSGSLDRSPGGPHPFPHPTTWDFTQHKPFKAVYETNRRSIYLMTQRIQRHPFLALFDGPDTNASTATRTASTTSLQALFLMNDPFVHEQARKLAARLMAERTDSQERIDRAFRLAFGRPASAQEYEQAMDYLAEVRGRLRAQRVTEQELVPRTWESFARVIFMSSEFVYVN
jgi:mono/diheme cytochrome c family protein